MEKIAAVGTTCNCLSWPLRAAIFCIFIFHWPLVIFSERRINHVIRHSFICRPRRLVVELCKLSAIVGRILLKCGTNKYCFVEKYTCNMLYNIMFTIYF